MKKMKITAFLLSGAILLGSCGTMNNTTKGGIIGGGSGAGGGGASRQGRQEPLSADCSAKVKARPSVRR